MQKTLVRGKYGFLFSFLFSGSHNRTLGERVLLNEDRTDNKIRTLALLIKTNIFKVSLFFKQGLRGERNQYYPYMLSARQEHHSSTILKNVFGMARLEIEPTTSRSRGERSNV